MRGGLPALISKHYFINLMTTAPNKTNEKNVQIGVKFFEDDSLSRINKSDKVAYLKEQGLSAD